MNSRKNKIMITIWAEKEEAELIKNAANHEFNIDRMMKLHEVISEIIEREDLK